MSSTGPSFSARSARDSLVTLQREPLIGPWLRTNALLGGFLGLVMGVGHQLTQFRFGEGDSSIGHRALAVLITTIGYAALLVVLAAFAGTLLLARAPKRRAAVASVATSMGVFLAVHLLAEALYVTSGSPLTIGALEFFANSLGHMARAVLEGYPDTLLILGVVTVLCVGLAVAVLDRATRNACASGPRLAVGLVVGFGVLFGLNELVVRDDGAWSGVWAASPELAFLESIHIEAREQADVDRGQVLQPPQGTELTAANLWNTAAVATAQHPPNVLLIMLESVAAHHMGFNGYLRPSFGSVTPNLDRIAAGSLVLERAWTTATHSNYAQMAVLSSLFPRRTSGLDTYKRLDYPRVLLHDFLHALDYKTATISSQDETWQGMLRFQHTDTPTLYVHALDHQGPRLRTGLEWVVPDHLTRERVVRWIATQGEKPWGAYVNFQMTHFPYKLPEAATRQFQPDDIDPKQFRYLNYPEADLGRVKNRYDNALFYVDQQVGALYDALKQSGQLDNTILVVTSDHGELFHQHGMVTHGRTLYEAEARVPLLVHWPKGIEARSSDAPVSHIDILPTLAELLEVAPHPSFQGSSFANPEQIDARHKAIFLNIQGMRSADAIVCWPYKLIKPRGQRPELYNLARDPNEEDDLFHTASKRAKRLERLLKAQMRAQLRYHHIKNQQLREERFAPRMLTCDANLGP